MRIFAEMHRHVRRLIRPRPKEVRIALVLPRASGKTKWTAEHWLRGSDG